MSLSSRLTIRQAVMVSAILLVSGAAVAWAVYARHRLRLPPLSIDSLFRYEVNPYALGVAVQSLVVPLILVYLFSRTPLFQSAIGDEPTTQLKIKLFAAFAVLQLLALNYELRLFFPNPDRVPLGFLVVVTAGLVGGWQVGFGVGVFTMLVTGALTSVYEFPLRDLFPIVYREEGFWGLIKWLFNDVFFHVCLFNLRAVAPIWAGLVVGLWSGMTSKERRFEPVTMLILGVILDLGGGYLAAIQAWHTIDFVHLMVPSALVTGVAFAVVGLIVRNVQAEVARRKAEVTELALARAELRALRAQINPHFLFNALNTIRYCVRTDPNAARRLLLDLSEIFQRALRSGEFSPLQDEISYAEAYLGLEKARLGERLDVVWSLPQQENPLLEIPIPTLTLQPVVENAVVHGIAPKPQGGRIFITVETDKGDLLLRVKDDGVGMSESQIKSALEGSTETGKTIGLRNVDNRLRALYGQEYGLRIVSTLREGTCVEMKVPLAEYAEKLSRAEKPELDDG